MAVYKRIYHGYDGPVTPEWSRFAIIPRYAYRDLFRSRMMTAFFVACYISPLVFLSLIYVSHNFSHWAELLGARGARSPIAIDSEFFLRFLSFQGALAFILTAFVGPGLVSRDLSNRALPLYLCRPFSQAEYVVGKMSVLLILLSLITWVPGLVLFGVQAILAGGYWFVENLWIAWALFAGAWIWILVIALLALAISAWIKWRIAAGALLLAVFFVAAGFGAAVNAVLEVHWGNLINLSHLVNTIWGQLFRVRESDVSVGTAWLILALIAAGSLELLRRKVRGFEVVK